MKPWQVKSWVIPEASADFVYQMEQVLDVYQRPYNPDHPVVNIDESPKQLISETKESYTDQKGVFYQDYEYKREGVADLYMITEALAGKREVLVKDNHNRFSYASVIEHIALEMYPKASKITLVEDNLSAHKLAALYEVLSPKKARSIIERIEVVRTPKHGSWLNIAECELSVLTRCGLNKRTPSKEQLEKDVKSWYEKRNKEQKGVNWQFTTKDARIKLKRLYPSIQT